MLQGGHAFQLPHYQNGITANPASGQHNDCPLPPFSGSSRRSNLGPGPIFHTHGVPVAYQGMLHSIKGNNRGQNCHHVPGS